MEESTWELLSNLTNAQEAIQLYLNKKNQEGAPGKKGMMSGLTILLLWKPRPKSRNQTQNLDSPGPRGLWTTGPPARIFLGLSPRKLTLKMMAHPVKQIKPRKLVH
ncbi:hypothetical protein DSO57_1012973 [Entomophthora muscae]|uniref:Uncharacterized protein n=1 Tax=Entomophthora muscae TaxID=34485 RepID=A0ACC2THL8_9FUNG|nr:hypothetical protein DSO57_1012973 [Entomophthora muscae]